MSATMKLEIDFTERPTKSQLVNALNDMYRLLNRTAGELMAAGDYEAADQPMTQLLNTIVHIKASRDMFDGGTSAGLSVPRPVPVRG